MTSIYDTIEGTERISAALTAMVRTMVEADGRLTPVAVIGPRLDLKTQVESATLDPIMVGADPNTPESDFKTQLRQICKRTNAACIVTAAEYRTEASVMRGEIEVVEASNQRIVIIVEHQFNGSLRFEAPLNRSGGRAKLGDLQQTETGNFGLSGIIQVQE